MHAKLVAAAGVLIAAGYAIGTSGLPGPWIARVLEGLLT